MRSFTVLACLLLCGCSLVPDIWEGGDPVSTEVAKATNGHFPQMAKDFRSFAASLRSGQFNKAGTTHLDVTLMQSTLEGMKFKRDEKLNVIKDEIALVMPTGEEASQDRIETIAAKFDSLAKEIE